MKNKDEIESINIQLYALFFTILTIVISIIITYNQKKNIKHEKTIFDSKQIYSLTLFNRILILLLALVFLIINYRLYNISKKENENLKPYILQIISSILVVIAGIITLYVVAQSKNENLFDIENPIV